MQKKLNLFDLISIGVGCIIGSGVFALMGVGINFSGRGITLALFISMTLCVIQSIALPLLTRIFEVEGGEYTANSLVCSTWATGFTVGRDLVFRAGAQAVTAIALTSYLARLIPALGEHQKVAALAVMILAYLCVIVGDKFAAKVQNVMCIFMYIALGLFVIFGLINMDPSAYAGEPLLPQGTDGLIMAIALMSYTCNGFQYVVNMGKGAENPTRNIPLAFCLSALVGAIIYGLIGFAATHAYSYAEIAGTNLGGIAEMIMPNAFYLFFLIGGAIFALATSMVGGLVSGYRPLMTCARDGWLPSFLAKSTKRGNIPYVYGVLFTIAAAAIILGLDLGDVATICLFPGAIQKVLVNFSAMKVPTNYVKEWKASGLKLSVTAYRALLLVSSIAAVILGYFYFTSNSDLQVVMILVTVGICIYSFVCTKFGHVNISAKKEYTINKGE